MIIDILWVGKKERKGGISFLRRIRRVGDLVDLLQDLEGDGLLGVLLVLALAVERSALDLGAHDEDAVGRIAPLAWEEGTYLKVCISPKYRVRRLLANWYWGQRC